MSKQQATKTTHIILQSKGGAGKSVVATVLAQYIIEKDGAGNFIDTDPSNNTLASFKSLNVKILDVMNKETEVVDQRAFDELVTNVLESKCNQSLVDTGSGDFHAISAYLKNNDVVNLLEEHGVKTCFHVVINYGQASLETLKCLNDICSNYNAPVVVWENEYFGKNQAKPLAEMAIITKNSAIIKGIVTLPRINPDLHDKDFAIMLQKGMTFADASNSTEFGLMEKTRLKKIKTLVFDSIDKVFV